MVNMELKISIALTHRKCFYPLLFLLYTQIYVNFSKKNFFFKLLKIKALDFIPPTF